MEELYLPSTDGKNQLHVVVWQPNTTAVGIVQISHGMVEYIKRYHGFAEYLGAHGFVVIGNDHLGHGQTAKTREDLGYFCPDHMSETVVADLYQVTRYAKSHYPDLPCFLFGHSMGSFMARRYIMTYGAELDGAIICGTGSQPETVLKAGRILVSLLKLVRGDRCRSKLLKKILFGRYNERISDARTSNDWLTKEEAVVDAYNADEYCTYSFTVNGYRTLLEVMSFIQSPDHVAKIPKKLPVFLIAGKEDPVGNYGKAVTSVYEGYKKIGLTDVSVKLYKNDRHELINETDKEVVYEDVRNWLNKHI